LRADAYCEYVADNLNQARTSLLERNRAKSLGNSTAVTHAWKLTKFTKNGFLNFAIKATVSIALVWWILQAVDREAILQHLRNTSSSMLLLLAIGLTVLGVFQAGRWYILLTNLGTVITLRRATAITLLGVFYSQALPSTIGGDVFRVWSARHNGASLGVATNSVIIDRVLGLLALLILCVLGLPSLLVLDESSVTAYAAVSVIALGISGLFVLVLIQRLPCSWTRWLIVRGLINLSGAFISTMRRPRTAIPVIGLSLVIQLGFVTITFLIGRSLDQGASFSNYFIIIPLVLIISSLPISIAGWGVREGAMVVGLGFVGVPADLALAVSVLLGGLFVLVGFISAALWFTERHLPGGTLQRMKTDAQDIAAIPLDSKTK